MTLREKWEKIRDFIVLLAVVITFISAYLAGEAAHKTDQTATRADRVATCVTGVLGDLLDSQNERADANAELQDSGDKLDKQFAMLLKSILDPKLEPAEKLQAFIDYQHVLDAKIAESEKVAHIRLTNPLPVRQDLVNCAKDEN